MLYYNTINELLKNTLQIVMKAAIFNQFKLVGGTALSLQIGHRVSIDIDLFSDQRDAHRNACIFSPYFLYFTNPDSVFHIW